MNLEISIFSGCVDSPLRAFVIQNRRPAQALSACLDRDLLISSPNCFASGHAYRFKSCPKTNDRKRKHHSSERCFLFSGCGDRT